MSRKTFKKEQDEFFTHLVEESCRALSNTFKPVKNAVIPNFSIYRNVDFFEYKISEEVHFSVGFVYETSDARTTVMMLPKTISAIKENSVDIRKSGSTVKPIKTPFIWSLNRSAEKIKDYMPMHKDGMRMRADLLVGDFGIAFVDLNTIIFRSFTSPYRKPVFFEDEEE